MATHEHRCTLRGTHMTSGSYRFPALYGYEGGSPGAWWLVAWDEELASFTAQLVADRGPEDLESAEEPVAVIGQRPGEFLEIDQLEGAMMAEEEEVHVPADLVDKLVADRDRYLGSLSEEASRELVERLAAAS